MGGKRGFTLIAAIFVVLVLTLLAITTSTLISSDAVIAVRNYYSQRAFFIASSGREYYLKELDGDSDWTVPPTPETKSFWGGYFTITTTNEQKNRITFISTGVLTIGATTYRRGIRSSIRRMGGGLGSIAEEYVLYWGGSGDAATGETNIGNNVSIGGDILANSDINMGSNSTISGDAYSSGDISGDTTGIEGEIDENSEMPEEPPSLESTYYDDQLATAATYPPGEKKYAGGNTLSGTTYVNGNLFFQNNCNISITGIATVVATGTVLVSNNSTFGDNLNIIAGGLITMENNITIGKYGIWYSSVGFDVGNNEIVADIGVGEGTAFITPGDIDFGNNCSFDGFLYAGGSLSLGNNTDFSGLIVAGYIEDIGENSTLSLNPDVIDWDGLTGFEGTAGVAETHCTDWDEVY